MDIIMNPSWAAAGEPEVRYSTKTERDTIRIPLSNGRSLDVTLDGEVFSIRAVEGHIVVSPRVSNEIALRVAPWEVDR